MFALECDELVKDFGAFRAVDSVTLRVEAGEVFGFLGPNGAGKTTTIRLLMGMLVPTSGGARICALDCHADRAAVKRVVGYLPDNPVFQDYLRGEEILRFVGEMHGLAGKELDRRVSELFDRFDLAGAALEFAANYSMGMKRKLALACAQIHQPTVYILDEPVNGLDPIAMRDIHNWILDTARAGGTVFLSTHLLDLAERLCTRVAIINHGGLLETGSPAELASRHCAGGSLEDVFFALAGAGAKAGNAG